MLNVFLRWIINASALILIAYFLPNFEIISFYSALIAALVIGIVNALIRPIILLLTLPINIVTLGLFTFVINALMLLLASTIVKGFTVNTFSAALVAAIILWLVSFLTNEIFTEKSSPTTHK